MKTKKNNKKGEGGKIFKSNEDLINAIKNIVQRYDYFQSPSESKDMWSEIGFMLFLKLGFTEKQLKDWILSPDKKE